MRISNVTLLSLFLGLFAGQVHLAGQEEEVAPPESSLFGVIQVRTSDSETGEMQVFTTSSGLTGDSIMLNAPMMSGDGLSMIGNSQFQEELNLVPEQKDQIKQLNKDFSKRMSDFFKGDGGRINLEDPSAIKDFLAEIKETKAAKIKEILLPHQIERLKQISLQSEMKMRGDSAALTGKKLAEALDIDDEQKKKIEEKAKELKTQLQKDIEKLKEKARSVLLDELSSEQRKKLESMLGEQFQFKQSSFNDRIQRIRDRQTEKSKK